MGKQQQLSGLDNLVRLSEYYEVTVDDLLKENKGLKIEENNEKIKDSLKEVGLYPGEW